MALTPESSKLPEWAEQQNKWPEQQLWSDQNLKRINDLLGWINDALKNLKWPDWKTSQQFFIDEINKKFPNSLNLSEGKLVFRSTPNLEWLIKALEQVDEKTELDNNNDTFINKDFAEKLQDNKEIEESENISVEQALAKEKAEPWYLLRICTEKLWENHYRVNFPNPNIEKALWLCHLFMNNPEPKEIEIVGWWWAWKWVRDWLYWSFFQWSDYIEILNWFEFKVISTRTPEEIEQLKKWVEEKNNKLLNDPKIKELYTVEWKEIPERKQQLQIIIEQANAFNIDPKFLISTFVKWWEFPIPADQLQWKLMMHLKFIQLCKHEYKWVQWEDWVDTNWWKETYQNMLAIMMLEENNYWNDKIKEIMKQYCILEWKEFNESDFDKALEWYKTSRVWNRRSWAWYNWEVVSWYNRFNPLNWEISTAWVDHIPDAESLYNWAWRDFARYKGTIKNVCESLKIPENVLIMLFIKEWSHWNPYARTVWSSAFWIAQTVNWTWNEITSKIAPKYWINQNWQMYNADHQIIAWAAYLRQNFDQTWSWWLALAKYNMWSINIPDWKAQQYARTNPAIARHIQWPVTWKSYLDAAVRYYTTV